MGRKILNIGKIQFKAVKYLMAAKEEPFGHHFYPLHTRGMRGGNTSSGKVEGADDKSVSARRLLVILEFKHYQRHVVFNMDGADFKNKVIHDGVRVLVAVRT